MLASKLRQRLAAACASRRSLDALIQGSLPHRARTQRSGRGWAALLGQRQDGTLCGGGTWDVAAGGPSSMRRTGWMMSMSCSATGAPPSLVQHQHPVAPSAGRSVPRRWVPDSRACTARAPSSSLSPAPGAMTRVRESAHLRQRGCAALSRTRALTSSSHRGDGRFSKSNVLTPCWL